MKILIDHGASHNLGDIAMLEAVVTRLLDLSEELEVHVLDRQGLTTELWSWPRVVRTRLEFVRPNYSLEFLSRVPFFWRYSKVARRWWIHKYISDLGRSLNSGDIHVADGVGQVSLRDWCRRYDGFHVVGGGNLTDVFAHELWRRCALIHAFADLGCPIVLSGQQIGPWKSTRMSDALGRALKRANFVGLREPTDSVDFCREAELPPDRYAVMGDDSFGLETASTGRIDSLLDRYGVRSGQFLAANVRIGSYAASHGDHLQEIAGLMRAFQERYQMPILILPIALNEADSDIASGHRLVEAMGGGDVKVVDEPDLTPGLVKGALERAYAAVGVSYHFCTFALSLGVPAICIHHGSYYSQKGRGLARFWGDDRISFPLGQGGSQDGPRRAFELIEDLEFRATLAQRASDAVSTWKTVFDSQFQAAFGRTTPARQT